MQNKDLKRSWHIYGLGTHFRSKGSPGKRVIWFSRCRCSSFCPSDDGVCTLGALFAFHQQDFSFSVRQLRTKASTGRDGLNSVHHSWARMKDWRWGISRLLLLVSGRSLLSQGVAATGSTSALTKKPLNSPLNSPFSHPNPLAHPTPSNTALLPHTLILLPELGNHEPALETDDLPEFIHVTQ